MRLAFCLFKYFPHSGLARDMLRIADEAVVRGHSVDVYAREWQGDKPAGIHVKVLGARGWSNHGRAEAFARRLAGPLRTGQYDAVVGFNKMPGLDFYYAADSCFAARARRRRPRIYELTPRYRSWCRQEAAVFGPGADTRILVLSEPARLEYRAFYATDEARLYRLPATLDRRHRTGALEPDRRTAIRSELGAGAAEMLLLMVGSGFHTKGVDRSLRALAALPRDSRKGMRLVVVGRGKPDRYRRLAQRLGISDQVAFTGGRDDVPALLRAADLLVHPARQENTGSVLLEALAAGLPVLTTANCGYAHHVGDAGAGAVLDTPFDQRALNEALRFLTSTPEREQMSTAALCYGQDEALYRMPETAVDQIEQHRGNPPGETPAFAGCVDPELADLCHARCRLEDWLQLEGDVFRRTRDRKTLRFEHAGRGYFIKIHYGVGWKEILKNLIQLKLPVLDAGNEWLAVHLLKTLGIPTMDAVACGVGRGLADRQSFIVTRELSGMISLEDFAGQARARNHPEVAGRRELVREVANIARTLHGNGINHRDFYLCHFLFKPDAERPRKLHVIDLHRAQIRHRTPRRWRVKDLGGLYYSALDAGLTHRDRLRFIKSYTGAHSLRDALADRSFWARVERRALDLKRAETRRGYADASGDFKRSECLQSARNSDRPTAKDFKHSDLLKSPVNVFKYSDPLKSCPLLNELIERPAAVMARGRVLKHDGTTTVVAVGDGSRRWVVKRYNTKSRWHALRRLVRGSRAVNCWNAAARLREAGIDTPRPVAALEERYFGVLRGRSYFIHEFVDGEALAERLRRGSDQQARLVDQAAGIVRRLRAAGIVHGDLKATNFLVSNGQVILVDLDATRCTRGRRLQTGLKKDLQRFLRNWSDQPDLLEEFTRQLR